MRPPHIAQAPPCTAKQNWSGAKSLFHKGGGACARPAVLSHAACANEHCLGSRGQRGQAFWLISTAIFVRLPDRLCSCSLIPTPSSAGLRFGSARSWTALSVDADALL